MHAFSSRSFFFHSKSINFFQSFLYDTVIISPPYVDTRYNKVNWKIKFQLSHTSDLNLLLQGYGVELTSPNIPAWYLFQP